MSLTRSSATAARCSRSAAHLADPDAVDHLITRTVEEFGGIDVLVNNAGGTFNALPENISPKGWHTVIDANLTSAFLMSRAAFPHLKERAPASIVNIGSIAGAEPGPGHVHYSVAKAAVHHMTKVLAYEWGSHGIRVNCIAPGVIETPKSAFAGNEEKKQAWIRRVPMGWLGRPLDIVGTTILLASEASAYINGAIIRIDGGPRSGTAWG